MKRLAIHFALSVLLTLAIIWFIISMLNTYTRHGKVYIVPEFVGMDHKQVMQNYGNTFHFIIADSIYQKDAPRGSVLQQDPYPGAKVKQGRNVYLVVVAQQPEKVVVPNLLNLSLRQALASIETAGLETGQISYIDHFARNAVVSQLYKGQIAVPGTTLFRGSTIDLVLGNGGEEFTVPFPMLIGLRPDELKRTLHNHGLNLGNEYFEGGCTSENGRAYRIQPFYRSSQPVRPGTYITVWYRSENAINFNRYIRDSLFLFENEPLADSLGYIENQPEI